LKNIAPPIFTLDFHPSIPEQVLRRRMWNRCGDNRLEPAFLYATPHQAALWREVFSPAFAHSYHPDSRAFTRKRIVDWWKRLGAGKIEIVGLGSGTGQKELALHTALKSDEREISFPLSTSARSFVLRRWIKLVHAGAEHDAAWLPI